MSYRIAYLKLQPSIRLFILKGHSRPHGSSHSRSTKPPAKKIPERENNQPNRWFYCHEFHLCSTCSFRNVVCHLFGLAGHIQKVRWRKLSNSTGNGISESLSSVVTLQSHCNGPKYMEYIVVTDDSTFHTFMDNMGVLSNHAEQASPWDLHETLDTTMGGLTDCQPNLMRECDVRV